MVVYTQEEKKMLEGFQKSAEEMSGWVVPMRRDTADEHSIRLWAQAFDPKNPLWNDPVYAEKSRWGSLIAPPLYHECISLISWGYRPPEELGAPGAHERKGLPFMIGEEFEFFRPIRAGERFRVWRHSPALTKDEENDDPDILKYTFMPHNADLLDLDGNMIANSKCFLRYWLSKTPPAPAAEPYQERVYTNEELDRINALYDAEEIRGSKTRWWEDVVVGEELCPAVLGPTTEWDMLVISVGRQDQDLYTMQYLRSQPNAPSLPDPVSNIPKCFMEGHISNQSSQRRGKGRAMHAGAVDRSVMIRVATNWMGDDAFMRRFSWQPLIDTGTGDTLFGHGRVTDKFVSDGEHMVELELWVTDMDDRRVDQGRAVIRLCSREDV